MEESLALLREILIKAQPITIPLKKENERTRKQLLWIHEGLLKGAECEKEILDSVGEAQRIFVLHCTTQRMDLLTQRLVFGIVLASEAKQERSWLGGRR